LLYRQDQAPEDWRFRIPVLAVVLRRKRKAAVAGNFIAAIFAAIGA
jgi:hypothetical protein